MINLALGFAGSRYSTYIFRDLSSLSSVLGSFWDKCSLYNGKGMAIGKSKQILYHFSYPSGKRVSYIILNHSPKGDCTRPNWVGWLGVVDWGMREDVCGGACLMPSGFCSLSMGRIVPQRKIWCCHQKKEEWMLDSQNRCLLQSLGQCFIQNIFQKSTETHNLVWKDL